MEENKLEPEQQGAGRAADGPQLDQSGQPESAQGGQEESPQSAPTGPPPEGDHQAGLLPNHGNSLQVPELTNQVRERFSLNHRESTPRSSESANDGDGDDRISQGDLERLFEEAYEEGYEHGLRDGLDDHSSESSLDSRSSESSLDDHSSESSDNDERDHEDYESLYEEAYEDGYEDGLSDGRDSDNYCQEDYDDFYDED